MDYYFREEHLWSVYPQCMGKIEGVVPFGCSDNRERAVDTLTFEASVGTGVTPERLPLFVGRNKGDGFHFYNLDVPPEIELPENVKKGQPIRGKAKRVGKRFVLTELEFFKP